MPSGGRRSVGMNGRFNDLAKPGFASSSEEERAEYRFFSQATGADRLEGLIERVTYFKEDSGFCVLRVEASRPRRLANIYGSGVLRQLDVGCHPNR
jgi:hypothetical protein